VLRCARSPVRGGGAPPRPGGGTLGPLRPEERALDPFRPGGGTLGPFRPGGEALGPFRPGGEALGPFRPGGEALGPFPASPAWRARRPVGSRAVGRCSWGAGGRGRVAPGLGVLAPGGLGTGLPLPGTGAGGRGDAAAGRAGSPRAASAAVSWWVCGRDTSLARIAAFTVTLSPAMEPVSHSVHKAGPARFRRSSGTRERVPMTSRRTGRRPRPAGARSPGQPWPSAPDGCRPGMPRPVPPPAG
jgi:hypothetical protein